MQDAESNGVRLPANYRHIFQGATWCKVHHKSLFLVIKFVNLSDIIKKNTIMNI